MKTGRKWLLAAALILGGAYAQMASAQEPIVIACKGCSTWQQLQAHATNYANNPPYVPNYTTILVVSTTQNLAAYFQTGQYSVCYAPYGSPGYPYATYCTSGGTLVRYVNPITPNQAQAQELDAVLAAKTVGRVRIDPAYGSSAHSAVEVDVNTGVRQVAPIRASLFGFQIYVNGKWVRAIPNLTEIEVVFPDGTKIKLLLKNVMGTVAWEVVSRTDANGNTINTTGSNGQGGSAAPPPPPPYYQDPGYMYCPVEVTSYVCIEVFGAGAQCPSTSGQVTIYLRPCGS